MRNIIIGIIIGILIGILIEVRSTNVKKNKRIDSIIVSMYKEANTDIADSIFIHRSEDEKEEIILRLINFKKEWLCGKQSSKQ